MYIYTAKIQKELMITTIFSKSKPINFLIVFCVLLVSLLILEFKYAHSLSVNYGLGTKIGMFLIVFFSVLLLHFIVVKNGLSQQSNIELLVFALFVLAVPQTFISYKIIVSNMFILMALRRMISIRSKKEIIKKLFDSGFLIGLASVFYFWSILFFPLIIISLLFFSESKAKYYFIPVLGLATLVVILTAVSVIFYGDIFSIFPQKVAFSFNYTAYNSFQLIGAITILLSFGLWSSVFYLADIKKKMRSYRPSYKIMFVACMLATAIAIITPNKNGSEMLFLFAPLSVIIMNYIETITDNWFKNSFLALLIIAPIVLLVL